MAITLYHWTHRRNLRSIAAVGLSDAYARTADRMLYGVTVDRILSALVHVQRRHGWRAEEMYCLCFHVKSVTRLGRPDKRYFRFAGVVPPDDLAIALIQWPFIPLTAAVPTGRAGRAPRRTRGRNIPFRPV